MDSASGPDPARIQSLPLFSSLTLEECAELASRTHEREYDSGHEVMHQGDGGYTFAVIESGTADVFVDGNRVRSVGPGDVLGEVAVLSGGHRSATVVTTSPMHMFTFFGLEAHNLGA